jgi:hypothetical protein
MGKKKSFLLAKLKWVILSSDGLFNLSHYLFNIVALLGGYK